MKYRIKVENYHELTFPPICPGCLASNPQSVINLQHKTPVPGVPIQIRQSKGWPFCNECSTWQDRKNHLARKIKISLGLSIPLLAITMYVLSGLLGIISQIFVLYSFPALFLMAGVILYCTPCICNRWARNNGSTLEQDSIHIINMGQQAFKKGHFLQFDCFHREYALSFVLLNKDQTDISVHPPVEI